MLSCGCPCNTVLCFRSINADCFACQHCFEPGKLYCRQRRQYRQLDLHIEQDPAVHTAGDCVGEWSDANRWALDVVGPDHCAEHVTRRRGAVHHFSRRFLWQPRRRKFKHGWQLRCRWCVIVLLPHASCVMQCPHGCTCLVSLPGASSRANLLVQLMCEVMNIVNVCLQIGAVRHSRLCGYPQTIQLLRPRPSLRTTIGFLSL